MKKLFSIFMLFGLFVIHIQANNDNNSLHTFNSGETISSNKVNQNFVLASNYIVKANNKIIGDFLGLNGANISFLTSNGYIVQINSIGKIKSKQAYYTTQQCDGDKYTLASQAIFGELFKSYEDYEGDGSEQLVYIPKDSTIVNVPYYRKI